MKDMNYLEILGLEDTDFEGKSEAEIQKELKTAQKEMRKACHPDRAAARGETEEETKINQVLFTKVGEAYEFLKDPAQRNAYLKQLNAPQPQKPQAKARPQPKTRQQAKPKPQHSKRQQRTRKKQRPKANYAAYKAQSGLALKTVAGLAMLAFKTANIPLAYASKQAEQAHEKLKQKSKTSKVALAARIGIGIINMAVTHSIPAAVTLSLMLGAVKMMDEPSLHITPENLNTANPICTGEFSRNMSQENFNTLVMLYASTDNPNFEQMLLSNANAHIRTGFSFEYALVQAYLESSWGENVSASTSSARGNHQFIEQSWLERFKKDAPRFSPALASYADQIYWANDENGEPLPRNGWRVHGGLEQDILDMRLSNPDLEAFLSLQWRAELHPNLVEHVAPENRDQLDILLERTNFDLLVSATRHLKENVALMLHNPMAMIDEEALAEARELQKVQDYNLAYTSQFLGPNGAIRFTQGVEQTPLRTASLDFAAQASANEGIFGARGERSYNEVDFVIDEKITEGLEELQERYEQGVMNGGYRSVCDLSFEMDAIQLLIENGYSTASQFEDAPQRPRARPADLGRGS